MISKGDLIKKYEGCEYLAIASMLKIVLYEVNFDKDFVFGATITHNGDKVYFLRQLQIDEHDYLYFPLHNHRHYRKDFEYLHELPMPPIGYKGKAKVF